MSYNIQLSKRARQQLRGFTAHHRAILMEGIEQHLRHQPNIETRHRKLMKPNPLAPWELRLGDFRVFYDIEDLPDAMVNVLAIGLKQGNRLMIDDQEYQL